MLISRLALFGLQSLALSQSGAEVAHPSEPVPVVRDTTPPRVPLPSPLLHVSPRLEAFAAPAVAETVKDKLDLRLGSGFSLQPDNLRFSANAVDLAPEGSKLDVQVKWALSGARAMVQLEM